MEAERYYGERHDKARANVRAALARHGLSYHEGGAILGGTLVTPSRSLEELIRGRDFAAIQTEFDRALSHVGGDPPAAVTAACAIVEAACKTYIADRRLPLPADQSVLPLWKVVQKDLDLDPARTHDPDLKRILGGLASIVEGVAAFRTHASSAHGRGRCVVTIEARHARLAIHAAHTIVTFLLETWEGGSS